MLLYDFKAKDIKGQETPLEKYKGKVVLIVNVASECGFTPQYEGLQALYDAYKEKGFEIIGFPCNQFKGQEPGTNEEILSFCSINYGVNFDIFAKIDVNGENADPLYKYLKEAIPTKEKAKNNLTDFIEGYNKDLLKDENITWNFSKFLVNRNGEVVKRFEPYIEPAALKEAIEELL